MDLARDGKPIGIEILDPGKLTLARMNRALRVTESAAAYHVESYPAFLKCVARARQAIRRGKGTRLQDVKERRPRK